MPALNINRSQLWRIIRRLLAISTFVVVMLALGVIIFVHQRSAWVMERLVTFANESQSGEFTIGPGNLTLVKHLPNITVEIDGLDYFEHPAVSRGSDESPIIHADQVYIELDIWTLILESVVQISDVSVRRAALNLETDTSGVLNITRAFARPGTDHKTGAGTKLDLKKISLDSVLVTWSSGSAREPSVFFLREMQASLSYEADIIRCKLRSTVDPKAFYFKKTLIREVGQAGADMDIEYDKSRKLLSLYSGTLTYQQLTLDLKGSYDHLRDGALEVFFDGSSNDMVLLSALIQKDIVRLNRDLLQKGDIFWRGKLYGDLKKGMPRLEFVVGATGINLTLPEQLGEFKDIGFEGSFRSGEMDDFAEAELEIRNLRGRLPGGSLVGYLRIQNFVKPAIMVHLNASARLNGYDRIFNIGGLKNLTGKVSIQSDYDGQLDFSSPDPPANKGKTILKFEDVGFIVAKSNKRMAGGNGQISLENNVISFDDVRFDYDSSQLQLEGTFTHPYHLLFKHENSLNAELHIRSDKFFTRDIIADSMRTARIRDKVSQLQLDLTLATTVSSVLNRKGIPDFKFSINNLSASLEKLADIKQLTASGEVHSDTSGLSIGLQSLRCRFPDGSFSLDGDLLIPERNSLVIDAHLMLDQVPWKTINDLLLELQGNLRMSSVSAPLEEMKTITADLNLSSSLISSPFGVEALDITRGSADVHAGKNSRWQTDNLTLHIRDMYFRQLSPASNITGLKTVSCELKIDPLKIPGIGNTFLSLSARASEDSGKYRISLHDINLQLRMPHGTMELKGGINLPDFNSLDVDGSVVLNRLSWNTLNELANRFQSSEQHGTRTPSSKKMEIQAARLNLTSSLKFHPFTITKLQVLKSEADLLMGDSTNLHTDLFSLSMNDILFDHAPGAPGAGLKSIRGKLNFESIDLPAVGKTAAEIDVEGSNDKLKIGFTTNLLNSKKDEGNLVLDLSGETLEYRMQYSISQLPIGSLGKMVNQPKLMEGPIDIHVDLQGTGTDKNSLDKLRGSITLSGDSLLLHGFDLDQLLKDYKTSQNFNLVDLGAFVVAGPAGAVVTKSSDFVKLLGASVKPTDKTDIAQLVTKCKLSEGLLITEDVAFATRQNRIALNGVVDYRRDSIPGVNVAVVDKNGCSLLDQYFYGKFNDIRRGKLNVAGTLSGSVTNLVNAIADKDCKPVYQGSVKHPSKK